MKNYLPKFTNFNNYTGGVEGKFGDCRQIHKINQNPLLKLIATNVSLYMKLCCPSFSFIMYT